MKRETAKWVHKAETDWEVAHTLAEEKPAAAGKCLTTIFE